MARPRALTADQAADAARRYRQGAQPAALAARYGCARSTIIRHLAETGTPMRHAGRLPGPVQGLYDAAQLLRGDLAGCTLAEAADALVRRAEQAMTTRPTTEGVSP